MNQQPIYITYETNPLTNLPEDVKIYKNRPKNKFFFDMKKCPLNGTEKTLHLSIVQHQDGFEKKYEFVAVKNNICTLKENVEQYVTNINSYQSKKVLQSLILELVLND